MRVCGCKECLKIKQVQQCWHLHGDVVTYYTFVIFHRSTENVNLVSADSGLWNVTPQDLTLYCSKKGMAVCVFVLYVCPKHFFSTAAFSRSKFRVIYHYGRCFFKDYEDVIEVIRCNFVLGGDINFVPKNNFYCTKLKPLADSKSSVA